MKIVIGKKDIPVNDKEIKIAKKLITAFLNNVKSESVEKGVPSLYFSTIIMQYVMAEDLLRALTPEALQIIMNASNESYEKNAREKENPPQY